MSTTQPAEFPALGGSAATIKRFAGMPPMGIDPTKRYSVAMETTLGTLVIALDAAAAPLTVNNFIFLPKPGKYQIGSLAMANAGPNTNGSQFFIVSGPSGVGLPPQYSLFGQVVKGLEIVDAMQNVATRPGDRPVEDVVIKSITITVAD